MTVESGTRDVGNASPLRDRLVVHDHVTDAPSHEPPSYLICLQYLLDVVCDGCCMSGTRCRVRHERPTLPLIRIRCNCQLSVWLFKAF